MSKRFQFSRLISSANRTSFSFFEPNRRYGVPTESFNAPNRTSHSGGIRNICDSRCMSQKRCNADP